MIRIKYDSTTGEILGKYRSSKNYSSITIDEDAKTIDNYPYIEITDEEHKNNVGKKMIVGVDTETNVSVYQEYVETTAELLEKAIKIKDSELQTQRDTYCTEEHKRLGTELICSTDADGNLEYDDSGNVIMIEGSLVYFVYSSSDQTNTLAKPAVILDSVLQKNSEGNYMVEYINYVCNIEDSSEESGFRKGFIKLTPEIALEILEHLIQRNNNYYTRCSNLREKIKDVSSIEELDNFNLN